MGGTLRARQSLLKFVPDEFFPTEAFGDDRECAFEDDEEVTLTRVSFGLGGVKTGTETMYYGFESLRDNLFACHLHTQGPVHPHWISAG